MPRRSSGRAGPRKRYTVDAFEGIDGLQDDVSEQPETRHGDDSDSADDFAATAGAEAEQEDDEDEDVMSGLEGDGEAENLSDRGSDAGENDLDDGMSIADEQDEGGGTVSAQTSRYAKPDPTSPTSMFNRGAFDTIRLRGSRYNKQLFFVGPQQKFWKALIKARDVWAKEDTLPVTRRCDAVEGTGGFHHSFFVNDETRKLETKEAWKWYVEDGGRKAFEEKQQFTEIEAEEARAYLPDEDGTARSFLMGPVASPRLSNVESGHSVPLHGAWEPGESGRGSASARDSSRQRRNGFIINIGAKVRCIEWVPNRSNHPQGATSQYLAIAVTPNRSDDPTAASSAFAPLPPYRASIQLWRFEATVDKVLDASHSPALSMVICTKWGDVKALKWCPSSMGSGNVPTRHLGLLAGIWGDGGLRVLDLDLPRDSPSTTYRRVKNAALSAHPPATVFTCLVWLSSTRIAAGTAIGCVAIFDIPTALTATSASANMRPTKYFSVACTYIVSISTAQPSHPHLLLTSAADGYNRMTDLRHPNPASGATIESPRGRSTHGAIAWHELSQCAITIDDNFAQKSLPLRRFFQSVAVARAKSACTAVATSLYHPFILTGTADGEVFGTNPMCRLLDTRQQAIVQMWFSHEWRRPTAAETDSQPGEDAAAHIGSRGLSRFVEGYKLELVSRIYREDNQARKKDDRQNMHFHTIYEEETAITALAWNPNKDYAGWAAAGMGDGLLRVEDLVPT